MLGVLPAVVRIIAGEKEIHSGEYAGLLRFYAGASLTIGDEEGGCRIRAAKGQDRAAASVF